MLRSALLNILLFCVVCSLGAQIPQPFDSVATRLDTLRVDTLRVDTLRADTLSAREDTLVSPTGVDTMVSYSCKDSILYVIPKRTMTLYTRGDIKYQQMQLSAERIHINWNTSVLAAEGIPDSSDSTKKKFSGTPVMKDGGEEYRGHELSYNFKTRKGKIDVGSTEIDQGYYHGAEIKKVDNSTLFVGGGKYTTCDAPEPHYYFGSPRMKVTLQDKVIAEPVYLYIADVPIFALPFGVFPNKGGRRSGIIAPAIVEDASRGRLLQHLGYYWAVSDYMDVNLRTDLYTKGSWAAFSDFRYALRYRLGGSVSGEYRKFITGERNDPGRSVEESYRIGIMHNQELNPTTRFNVNFTFASNNSYRNTIDIRQALDQSITSNATLSKYWEGTPNSFTLNVSRRQNLIDGSIDETLPSISFNHSQSYPLRRSKSSGSSGLSWYEMIGIGYSASATNSRAKLNRKIAGIKTSTGGTTTFETVEDFERDKAQSIGQSVNMSIAPKLGYFTISPSLSYRDDRSFSDNNVPQRNPLDSSLMIANVRTARRTGFLSSGVAASTKLYGTVQPGLFGVEAIRHTVTPSLSFSYQKQIVGEDNLGRQMFMSLNIGNVFEMKTKPQEEGKEPEKIQLLNLGTGVSYNFSADSLNFSPIGLSYRTDIANLLSVDGSATFDLYKLQQTGPESYVRVNKFLYRYEGRLARLTDWRISLSTSLSGEKKKASGQPAQTDTTGERKQASGTFGIYQDEEPDFSIPWRLSLSFDYAENKVPPFQSRSSNLRGSLEFNLTENWKFSMSGGYDITNKELVVPNINISRDLHCWIMNFNWVPIGTYRQYRLEIRVKASQLQDLKVTKQGSERGIY